MCPVCVANLALVAAGAASSGGLSVFATSKFLRKKEINKIKGNQNESARDRVTNESRPNELPTNRFGS